MLTLLHAEGRGQNLCVNYFLEYNFVLWLWLHGGEEEPGSVKIKSEPLSCFLNSLGNGSFLCWVCAWGVYILLCKCKGEDIRFRIGHGQQHQCCKVVSAAMALKATPWWKKVVFIMLKYDCTRVVGRGTKTNLLVGVYVHSKDHGSSCLTMVVILM